MSLLIGTGPQGDGLLAIVRRVEEWFRLPFVVAKYAQLRAKVPVIAFGWKEREIQLNQDAEGGNRIVFMPGSGLSKRTYGTIARSERSEVSPRANRRWDLPATVSIWAVDTTNLDDDRLQWSAVTGMVERLVQAIDDYATVENPTSSTVVDFGTPYQDEFSVNRHYGVELLVPMAVRTYLRGIPLDQVTNPTVVVTKEPFNTLPPAD